MRWIYILLLYLPEKLIVCIVPDISDTSKSKRSHVILSSVKILIQAVGACDILMYVLYVCTCNVLIGIISY